MSRQRQLVGELTKLKHDLPLGCIGVELVDNNVNKWRAQIAGAQGTPYEGGVFTVLLEFNSNYPFAPPAIVFETKIFHPGVNASEVCLNVVQDWSMSNRASDVLCELFMLISDPSMERCINPEVGAVLSSAPTTFAQTAKEWTSKFATP